MGYSKGGDSKGKNVNTTVFPGEFLSGFESKYGRGFSLDELMGGLGQPQSIFGNGGQMQGYGGQTATLPGSGGSQGGAGNGAIPFDVVNSMVNSQYATGDPRKANQIMAAITQAAGPGATGITLDQLRSWQNQKGSGLGGDAANYLSAVLPSQLTQFTQPGLNRLQAPSGPDLSGLQIPQTLQRLFGAQASKEYTPYQFQNVPGINAATMQAAEANIAPGGFDNYQQALYRSMVNPMQRTLTQQGAEDDRALQAELAQSGLASSGAGLGQLSQQRRQRSEQLRSASLEAADRATQQRFGAEYQQAQFNAQQQQAARLANAGFNMDAQKQNAANIIQGNIAQSENYLKTMGLNQQAAQAMREDFLQMVGLTQKELERLDASHKENLGILLNNWLQQGALLGNLGQRGSQRNSSNGSNGGGLTITGQSSSS